MYVRCMYSVYCLPHLTRIECPSLWWSHPPAETHCWARRGNQNSLLSPPSPWGYPRWQWRGQWPSGVGPCSVGSSSSVSWRRWRVCRGWTPPCCPGTGSPAGGCEHRSYGHVRVKVHIHVCWTIQVLLKYYTCTIQLYSNSLFFLIWLHSTVVSFAHMALLLNKNGHTLSFSLCW